MTSVALPDIRGDFGVADDDLTWVVTAYLIPFATGAVIYGRLADIVGTKPMYVFGLTLFIVASFAAAAAGNFWVLVAARAFQGFGGTAVPSLSMATIVRTTDDRGRERAMGVIVVAVGAGFGLGPVLGGTLTEWLSWRGPFLATAIASVPLLPLALIFVPGVSGDRRQTFDYAGALLLTLAITGDVIALNRLPQEIGDTLGLAGLASSVPLWLLFAARTRFAAVPFVSRALLANRRFVALSLLGASIQGTHFAVITMIPLILSRYHDLSVIRIGLYLLPGASALAIFGMAGGLLVSRLGMRTLIVVGSWMMFCGAFTLHVGGAGWEPVEISALYVVIAAGYGMVNASVISAATSRLGPALAGVGVGVFNLAFFLGGAISVALAGAILRAREDASQAVNPLFDGRPIEFSDAFLVVVGGALIAFLLAVFVSPEPEGEPSEPAVETWAIKPRPKPNVEVTRPP
jgi:predicted MFS family arabinose efflux permease